MIDITDITGIVQAMIPVSDLARSAAWYADLLGLAYMREFTRGDKVTGCALGHPDAGWGISFRLRGTTAGDADLRGEHPVIFGVPDLAALERIRAHADRLGYAPTSGVHADAAWVEVIDPDGIAVRFGVPVRRWTGFVGVRDLATFYEEPVLAGPPIG
jgi:catechol 2,3-dioxygenase-like lactoylglutathione lyase family enzyme